MREDYEYIDNVNEPNTTKSDTLTNILDTLPKVIEGVKENVASPDGYTLKEQEEGKDKKNKGYEVKILGMKPLVFVVVSLGVVIASGIAISRLGKVKT
jgi:hypothetical protein